MLTLGCPQQVASPPVARPPEVTAPKPEAPEVPDRPIELALGDYLGCVVMASGKVRCWGDRDFFETGEVVPELEGARGLVVAESRWAKRLCGIREGEAVCLVLPHRVERRVERVGIRDARQLVPGGLERDGLCALRADGTVTCWAQAYAFRDVGDDGVEKVVGAQVVEGVPRFVALHRGRKTCGETSEGDYHCWRFHSEEATQSVRVVAAPDPALRGAKVLDGNTLLDVSGALRVLTHEGTVEDQPWGMPAVHTIRSDRFACGITSEGDQVVCGSGKEGYLNRNGVLGLGHTEEVSTAAWGFVSLPGPVQQVEVGELHACALLRRGEVYCWGANENQQLGRPRRSASTEPTLIPLDGDAIQVASDFETTCAVLDDERVVCWGLNTYDGLTELADRARQISVNGGNEPMVCGHDGTRVWCHIQANPYLDLPAKGVVEVLGGWQHVCWRDAAGQVMCGGYRGEWSNNLTLFPATVAPGLTAKRLLTSGGQVCAEIDGGAIRCIDVQRDAKAKKVLEVTTPEMFQGFDRFFSSNAGACGVKNGALLCHEPALPFLPMQKVVDALQADAVANGPFLGCALRAGEVSCWGSGQDGAGGYWGYRSKPTKMKLPFAVDEVTAGRSHTCVRSGSKVYCMGSNEYGQLAKPHTNDVFPSPMRVELR